MNTTKLHQILIPVDFSPSGECALEYGAYLASKFNANLILLHILEGAHKYPHDWFNDTNLLTNPVSIKIKATKKLNEYATTIAKKYGIHVQYIYSTGNPAQRITETVHEQNIDLIVMGTHGANGFEEFFMGSNAHKVVTLSPCPVITIREGFSPSEIKSIVLPIDESLHSRQKVNDILPLAAQCHAVIHILGLLKGIDETDLAKLNIKLDTVEDAVKKAGVIYTREVLHTDNIALAAMKYAEDIHAEMLSTMTDHESHLTGMFMGAFAQQIVNHSKVPVLSIKPMRGNYAYPT